MEGSVAVWDCRIKSQSRASVMPRSTTVRVLRVGGPGNSFRHLCGIETGVVAFAD